MIDLTNEAYEEAMANAESISQNMRSALTEAFADGEISPDEYQNILSYMRSYNDAIAKAAAEAARTAARTAMLDSVKIDMSRLGEIRRDAAETRDSLIVEEENAFAEPEAAAQEFSEEPGSEVQQAAAAGAAGTQAAPGPAVQPAASPDTPLDPDEYFFLHALLYGEEWRSRLKERHIQLSMLADGINEKMMDLIGDTVIEFAGDTPEIIEDYTEDLREMIPE